MAKSTNPQAEPKQVNDLSPRVVSLARAIDRLPPGTYSIAIIKGLQWDAQINRVEQVQTMKIDKKG